MTDLIRENYVYIGSASDVMYFAFCLIAPLACVFLSFYFGRVTSRYPK